ncbi:hypothetical protein [Allomuricauda sp. d1]|uniref:hypothetical protein n=1 Tax=Allomuricauda sp. d1 TaxID=3136725 RepID=UPI0031D7B6B0
MKKWIVIIVCIICFINGVHAQCLAPVGAASSIPANPVDKINRRFKFDYKISSDLEYAIEGDVQHFTMDYYVNTADGSILFPSGPLGFFKNNLGVYQSTRGRIDGAVWLANGQLVTYVYDRYNNEHRAITRQSSQTANIRIENDLIYSMHFFSKSEERNKIPEPMPSHVNWDTPTQGYVAEMREPKTGLNNIWTMYFDTAPTPIKTTAVMVGFMVGILKDMSDAKCNRLIVYNKVNIGGPESGNYIQVTLNSMIPSGITFDASEYKPMIVGGDEDSDIEVETAYFEEKMGEILLRKETLREKRKICGSDYCREMIDKELEELTEREERLNCRMAKAMGLEDMMDECH